MADRAGDGLFMGMVLGAMAGAIGVYAMDRTAQYVFERTGAKTRAAEMAANPNGLYPAQNLIKQASDATGVTLASKQAAGAATAVHYMVGVLPAALYGGFRDRLGFLGGLRGLLFGLAAFLVEDEYAKPQTGLSGPNAAYPWQTHGRGLVAHLAFGAATDAALRVLKGPPR